MSPFPGGDERVRTDDPLLAKQVLSQLSYTPMAPRPEAPRGPSKLYSELPLHPQQLQAPHAIRVRSRCLFSYSLERR